jgi:uncharacterized protein (TIGR03067 family)
MKKMPRKLLIGLVALTIWPAIGADNSAVEKDLALMQGEWSMVSGSADGQPMPDEMLKQMRRVCRGDETTTTMGGQVFFKAKITLDPSKRPKTIDYEMTEGLTKGNKQLGIYEVEGDTFKSCFGKPGGERPTDFTTGQGRTLSVWKREKPKFSDAIHEPKPLKNAQQAPAGRRRCNRRVSWPRWASRMSRSRAEYLIAIVVKSTTEL